MLSACKSLKQLLRENKKIHTDFWPKFLLWNLMQRMGSVYTSCSSPPPLASAFVGHPSLGSHFQSPWMRYQPHIPQWHLLLCCSPIARILFLQARWEPSKSRKDVRACTDKTQHKSCHSCNKSPMNPTATPSLPSTSSKSEGLVCTP